ncbi:GDSL-type esterase/lipase family protein [Marinicellulosiphila megalodicopiae]|uniref:GDSL-type esterase/lipase family protein n=1 Tax=Marinicellulosiphila megalodicopiae TaxID=2724896 RepID=UPI003BB08DED
MNLKLRSRILINAMILMGVSSCIVSNNDAATQTLTDNNLNATLTNTQTESVNVTETQTDDQTQTQTATLTTTQTTTQTATQTMTATSTQTVTQTETDTETQNSMFTPIITIEETDGLCLLQGVIETQHANSIDGYSNSDNNDGATIFYQFEVKQAGDHQLSVRYANGSALDRPMQLHIKNQSTNQSTNQSANLIATANPGVWDQWFDVSATLYLDVGVYDVELIAQSETGLANIDSLTIKGIDLGVNDCTVELSMCDYTSNNQTYCEYGNQTDINGDGFGIENGQQCVVANSAQDPDPYSCSVNQNTIPGPKIHIIGDSTVTNYSGSYFPQTGWGQVLPYFFDQQSGLSVTNKAIGGRSSRSFYQEGRWQTALADMQAGDYLFIQFGHNDRDFTKEERFTPVDDFVDYLEIYINESRAVGVTPILVTPMIVHAYRNGALRNVFTEDGNHYATAMKDLGVAMDVPVVDLNQKSWDLVSQVGERYANEFLFLQLPGGRYDRFEDGVNDYTHFQQHGALEMARLIVEGLNEISSNESIAWLTSLLKPTYNLTINTVGDRDNWVTKSNAYPANAPITLQAITDNNSGFLNWNIDDSQTQTDMPYQWVMPEKDVSVTANFTQSFANYPHQQLIIIGDSTVATWSDVFYPQRGWGQMIQPFFDANKITVENRARSGRSSKSYYNEAEYWPIVKELINPGDFVLIQFGINDRNSSDPLRYAPTGGEFEDYLTRYVNETKAKGGHPILVSTIPRNGYNADGTVYDSYHEHPVVTRELAAQLNVPLVDLDGRGIELLESKGQDYSGFMYYMNVDAGRFPDSYYKDGRADNVHLQVAGAIEFARLVSDEIKMSPFSELLPIQAALKPLVSLQVGSTSQNAMVTQGFSYPEGMQYPISFRENGSGDSFLNWINLSSSNSVISTSDYYLWTMGSQNSLQANTQ